MANKILVIDSCHKCFVFDNEYYGYDEVCTPLGRKIARIDYDNYPIPDDCPLKTTAEKATNFILDT